MIARFAALGFDDPEGATRRLIATWQAPRLQSMPEASRNRLQALVNTALPLIARRPGNRAEATSATLGRLLDFLEAIARRSAYLSLLTEYPHTLERVIRMMHASGWAATFLTQHPILLDELLDDRIRNAVFDPVALAADLELQLAAAPGDTERQMDILREAHHAQLFHLLAQDLAGDLTVESWPITCRRWPTPSSPPPSRRPGGRWPRATARCRSSPSSPTASWAARSWVMCPTST
jgi:glutamate-ammonia-ligase adenylyltransferase